MFWLEARFKDCAQGSSLNPSRLEERSSIARQFRNACDDLATSLNLEISTGALKAENQGSNGVNELYPFAPAGDTELVRFMLKSGTDPSIRTNFNWAPLHWAANNCNLECVKLLKSAGADVDPISDQNTTPLDLAINDNQLAIIEVLSRAGAKRSKSCLPRHSI